MTIVLSLCKNTIFAIFWYIKTASKVQIRTKDPFFCYIMSSACACDLLCLDLDLYDIKQHSTQTRYENL